MRVLVDGIGTSDVSNTSVDHATTIEPITLERIEVLRGPAVLLYGSQAIGGAVNVIDKRIPTRVPDEAFHLDAFGGLDSATNLRTGAASLDVGLTSNLVFHVDGSYRKSGDARSAASNWPLRCARSCSRKQPRNSLTASPTRRPNTARRPDSAAPSPTAASKAGPSMPVWA